MHTINKQKTIQNVILYGLLLIGGVFSVLPMILYDQHFAEAKWSTL